MARCQLPTLPPVMPVIEIPVVCSCIDSTTRSPTFTGLIMMELSPSVSLVTGKKDVSRVIGGWPLVPPDTGPDVGLTALTVGMLDAWEAVAGIAQKIPITATMAIAARR